MSAKMIRANKYALIMRDHSLIHVILDMSYKKIEHLVKVLMCINKLITYRSSLSSIT